MRLTGCVVTWCVLPVVTVAMGLAYNVGSTLAALTGTVAASAFALAKYLPSSCAVVK